MHGPTLGQRTLTKPSPRIRRERLNLLELVEPNRAFRVPATTDLRCPCGFPKGNERPANANRSMVLGGGDTPCDLGSQVLGGEQGSRRLQIKQRLDVGFDVPRHATPAVGKIDGTFDEDHASEAEQVA